MGTRFIICHSTDCPVTIITSCLCYCKRLKIELANSHMNVVGNLNSITLTEGCGNLQGWSIKPAKNRLTPFGTRSVTYDLDGSLRLRMRSTRETLRPAPTATMTW